MAKILDLSTNLRSRFWKLWETARQELKLPENISHMSPERAYLAGHREGFWQGALAAARVLSVEITTPRPCAPNRDRRG